MHLCYTGCPKKKYLSEISGSEMHMENLDRFGPCQIILDHFYTLGFFGPFGPFWTILDHFGPFGPFWTVLDRLDHFHSKKDHGIGMAIFFQNGPEKCGSYGENQFVTVNHNSSRHCK